MNKKPCKLKKRLSNSSPQKNFSNFNQFLLLLILQFTIYCFSWIEFIRFHHHNSKSKFVTPQMVFSNKIKWNTKQIFCYFLFAFNHSFFLSLPFLAFTVILYYKIEIKFKYQTSDCNIFELIVKMKRIIAKIQICKSFAVKF